MDLRAKSMDSRKKQLIDEARHAVLNQEAREEQKLIWELAEVIHSVRTSWMVDDEMEAKKILYENDYTVGSN